MLPDVGAVVRDEDRDVADERRRRARARRRAAPASRARSATARSGERDLVRERRRARRPARAASRSRSGAGQRVHAVSPCARLMARKSAKSSSQAALLAVNGLKSRAPPPPCRKAANAARSVPRGACRDLAAASRPSSISRSTLDQRRVAGERGLRAVRGIAVAGRSDREHLPPALAGRGQEVDERAGLAVQIAAFGAAGQAGRVQEHPARAVRQLRQAATATGIRARRAELSPHGGQSQGGVRRAQAHRAYYAL